MLDVTRLRVLVAVARYGSVTAAARELNYAQPSVSHHLARLEAETGIKLIQRAAKQYGAAVICVTHDPRLEAYADRVIHLEDGLILSDRRVDHISPDPAPATDPHRQPVLVGA